MGDPSTVAWSLRASDGDRERIAETLRRSWCEGYLSFDTFSERVDLAYRARSWEELRRLIFDLPPAPIRALLRLWHRVAAAFAADRDEVDAEAGELHLPERADVALLLGRAADCDFRLSDETVSRHHAELRYDDGMWVISDLNSTNGVYVNGRRVWHAEIRPGDQIALAKVDLTVI